MTKKHIITTLCVMAVMTALYFGVTAFAQASISNDDPLVTKSYVDDSFNQLLRLMQNEGTGSGTNGTVIGQADREAIILEMLQYIELFYGDMLRNAAGQSAAKNPRDPSSPPLDQQSSSLFQVLHLQAGQTVIGFQGTEMILRGGTAVVVSGINGLCDMTVGADITSGAGVKLNHLLIVPTTDNRGLRITSEAWLMVKGEYVIEMD